MAGNIISMSRYSAPYTGTGPTGVIIYGNNAPMGFLGTTFRVTGPGPATTFTVESSTRATVYIPERPIGVEQVECVAPGGAVIGYYDFTFGERRPAPVRFEPPATPSRREVPVQVTGFALGDVTVVRTILNGVGGAWNERPFQILDEFHLVYTSPPYDQGTTTIQFAYAGGTGSGVGYAGPRVIGRDVPAGRGRWRILYARRGFTNYVPDVVQGEIMDARSRRLERTLNGPARFTFAVDGHSPTARNLKELEHDLLVYRWNEVEGADEEVFRGIVVQTQDTLSEQVHTVTITAHDNLAVTFRRPFANALTFRQRDQDWIVRDLLTAYLYYFRSSDQGAPGGRGTDFDPAATIPYSAALCYPDGSEGRPVSGRLRDRDYPAQTNLGEALTNLANVLDGFDFDVRPVKGQKFIGADVFRIFYPYQGVQRTDFAFVYGSTVSALSRSVNSAAFGNYVRVLGQSDEGQPQVFAEAWTADANDLVSNPRGFWALAESASDVTEVATLREKAAGTIAEASTLVPAYSLSVRPGTYRAGDFDIGDTVGLQIRSGRLDVDTWVRVLAMSFAVGDDGEEDIEVEVGRPAPDFIRDLRTNTARIGALERR